MRKRLSALTLALVMALALLPTAALAADSDFVIVDGVLEKYNGPGGDIVIPDGVYWIKASAFSGAKNITGVVIPEGVIAIGGSLSVSKRIEQDGSITITGSSWRDNYEFGGFSGQPLTSVTLPSSLSNVMTGAFAGTDLEKLEFPEESNLKFFGEQAFSGCKKLKTVSLPRMPKSYVDPTIHITGFNACPSLETVILDPEGEYAIDFGAFAWCQNLKTIENAQTIKKIGDGAFGLCDSLENMTISKDLDPVSISELSKTPWYQKTYGSGEFVVVDGTLSNYNGPGGAVVIPDNLGITAIGPAGFQKATSIVIPEGVTEITEDAFYGCGDLKTVSLPSTLRYIGSDAFMACEALNSITLPDGLRYIGKRAFQSYEALQRISLPDDVLVDSTAFWWCENLSDVTFSDSVVFCCERGEEVEDFLQSPFGHTPFGTALYKKEKGKDFVMLGGTLYQYQGPGGTVTLPEQTRTVRESYEGSERIIDVWSENLNITSIVFPEPMKEWLDKRYTESENEQEKYCISSLLGGPHSFYKCKRLTELKNMPFTLPGTDDNSKWYNSKWKQYLNNLEQYSRLVDTSKCLGTPSERIAAQSNAIVSAAGAVTDYDKAKAIADWVAKNVKYDWDVSQNTKSAENAVTDPEQVLNGAATICDGYTKLTNQLLWAHGIPANRIVGKGKGEDHSWTEAWIDGRWVIIDTTWMAPFMNGTREQGYEPNCFDMSLVEFSDWHIIEDRPYTMASQLPAEFTAYASTQIVRVDGMKRVFQCYALKDANGNDTNYIKLRDVASVLNGTAVQFNVGWDGAVNIETGKGYTPNGSEMNTPFSGDRAYENATAETRVNGSPAALEAIVLKDDQGGAYTYYKLRDLGAALGFRVDWSAEKGIFIETK